MRTYTTRPARTPIVCAAVIALAMVPGTTAAQTDATGDPGPLFDGRDAWIAAAYLGTAAVAFPFDERIARAARDSTFQETFGLKPTATVFNLLGVPGAFVISLGLYSAGRLADIHEMADAGLHITEAIALSGVVTYTLKFMAGRARPNLGIDDPFNFELWRGFTDEEYKSFPSGHTSASFAAAAAAAHEIHRIWGGNELLIGAMTYGPAAIVGFARMFDNRHWASDVVFGAAIGAFSGWKMVQYNHQAGTTTRVDDWLLSVTVVPGDWSRLGVSLVPVPRGSGR